MKLEELSRILRETDPAAVLVGRTALDRVIQNASGIAWVVWRVPHNHCFVVDRSTLFKHVELEELNLPTDYNLPERVLLLERPTAEQLGAPAKEVLGRYWRLLFHASTDLEFQCRLAKLTAAELRERVAAIGPTAFEEARNVLIQDGLLTDKADDRTAYAEFAAYYLELKFFNPPLIPVCFPSLPSEQTVEAVLARDVDGAAIFRATRLPGTSNPEPRSDDQSDESHDYYKRLERGAKRASAVGDTVGSAILHTRAARVAPGYLTDPAKTEARKEIAKLVDRLHAALKLSEGDVETWKRTLPILLDKADQGNRPVEAALLYDIQRACLDHEQKIYEVGLFDWMRSLGETPIMRELVGQRFVRVPAQLRSATRRLAAARLTDADRQTLAGLLRRALDQAEWQLRDKFGPLLDTALRDAGLSPSTLPERAAFKKTLEELLDRISSTGYLSFGDLRDAIARGQMKLPDLSGPNEHIRGDPLRRLDRRLATQLDGVYRRAESYTRGLEYLTALNFGTQTGRWLTRNVTVPFGAAFLLAQFIWLFYHERLVKLAGETRAAASASAAEDVRTRGEAATAVPSFFGGWNEEWWFHTAWVGLGVFLVAVIQSAGLRAALVATGQFVYRAARFVFWEVPGRVWGSPLVRAVFRSVPFQLVLNYLVRPLALCAIFWVLPIGLWETGWPVRVVTFLIVAFMINTRFGWRVEAVLFESVRRFLELIPSLPAMFGWLNDIFRELVAAVEWTLARIEDWLRLRGKTGPVAVVIRAVAGVVWMPFAFLVRFYTVVLIEPMINPLKLPLSILFAKFVYPLLLLFPGVLQSDPGSLLGYSSPLVGQLSRFLTEPGAYLLVMGTLWLLPDACTFLFWEMRENWRLYRANRPATIHPASVGDHGEPVGGLLHWGFHSGTVPRLYSKLRTAEREAARTDVWRDARTYRAALRSVEEAVRRFVTRDFVEVLHDRESGWTGPRLTAGRVILGTNRIRLELTAEDAPEGAPAMWLEWEDRFGWLMVRWAEPGFLPTLTDEEARIFGNALAYLYRRAGVDVVQEQVRAAVPREAAHFDLSADGLLVWYGSRDAAPLLYDIADPAAQLRPRVPGQRQPTAGPVLDASRLLFNRSPMTWSEWAEVWKAPVPGDKPPRLGAAGGPVLLPRWAERPLPAAADVPKGGDEAPAALAEGDTRSGK